MLQRALTADEETRAALLQILNQPASDQMLRYADEVLASPSRILEAIRRMNSGEKGCTTAELLQKLQVSEP
jgi:hypothetical protein